MYRKTCTILNRLLDTRIGIDLVPEIPKKVLTSTFSYVFAYQHQIATIFRSLVVGTNRSAKLNRIQRTRASNRAVHCIAIANPSFRRGANGIILAILRRTALCEDLRQKEVRGVLPHVSDDKSSAVQFHSRRVADANTRCILSQCIVLSASRRLEKHTERRNWKLKLESVLSRFPRLIRHRSRFYFFFN